MAEENKIVTAYDYLNMWYEKSGENNDFHPSTIRLSDFINEWGCWSGLDTLERCLWHDNYTGPDMIVEDDVYNMFNVKIINHYEVDTEYPYYGITKNYGTPNQLIKKSDLTDFNLAQIKMDNCTVTLPSSLTAQIQVSMTFQNSSWKTYPTITTPWLTDEYGPGVSTTVTQSSDMYMLLPEVETNCSSIILYETVKSENYKGITGQTGTAYALIDGILLDISMRVVQVTAGVTGYTSILVGNTAFDGTFTGVTTIEDVTLPEYLFEYQTPPSTATPVTYIELPWYVYSLQVGTNSFIPLSTYMMSCNPYGTKGDFISLSGAEVILKDIPFTTGLTSGQKVIKINTIYVNDSYGKNCYFRVPFSVGSSSSIAFYLCFRCFIYSNEIRPDIAENGGCRIWLTDTTTINLSTGYNGLNGDLIFTPHEQLWENQFTLPLSNGAISLNNHFSDAVITYYSMQVSTITAEYNSSTTYGDADVQLNSFISFISPSCITLEDVSRYLHGSPLVQFSITR